MVAIKTTINGERLKALRKESGFSAEEMGKAIGKGKAAIYHYEENTSAIPKPTLLKLAGVLDTTSEYLQGKTNCRNNLETTKKDAQQAITAVEHILTFKQYWRDILLKLRITKSKNKYIKLPERTST